VRTQCLGEVVIIKLRHRLSSFQDEFLAAGLDTDKLDYLVRDQHFIYTPSRHPVGLLDLSNFKSQAFLVKTVDEDGELCYEVAYKLNPDCVQHVSRAFQTRANMHNQVYQFGCGRLRTWNSEVISHVISEEKP
jgi:HD superfamily phosphohydrolase